jgi:chemotaxis signal transduction protein
LLCVADQQLNGPEPIMIESLLMITIQSQRLLVVARTVREVLGEKPWIPVPGARHEIPGVVGWGRRAVALLDLARVFPELRPLLPGEKRPRMLLLEVADSHLAVPADIVSAVMDVDATSIRPRALTDFPLCQSEVLLDGDVLPLLDPQMLLAREGLQ